MFRKQFFIISLLTVFLFNQFAFSVIAANDGDYEFNLAEISYNLSKGTSLSESEFNSSMVSKMLTTTAVGQTVDFYIDIEKEGLYTLELLANFSGDYKVYIDGEAIGGLLIGSNQWTEYTVGHCEIKNPGAKKLTLESQRNGVRSSYIGKASFKSTNVYMYPIGAIYDTLELSDAEASTSVLGSDTNYQALNFKPDGKNSPGKNSVAVGKSISFTIDVAKTGLYKIGSVFKSGASRGLYDFYIDDNVISNKTSFASGGGTANNELGYATLEKGEHKITFMCSGKPETSTDYLLVLYRVDLKLENSTVSSDGTDNSTVVDNNELEMLAGLGIIDSSVNPDDTVSRKELAKITANLCNLGKNSYYSDKFEDVTDTDEYSKYICTVTSIGYINETSTKYRPNDAALTEDAVSMLLNVLGYKNISNKMFTAGETGLLKNVNADGQKELTYSLLIRLINNALDMDMFIMTDIGEYELSSESNILNTYHKLEKGKGIVTGNERTRLHDTEGVNEGYVEIDSVEFLCGNTDVESKLGYFIEFYYENKDDEREIKYYKTVKNSEMIITSDNLDTFEDNKLYYYDDVKTKSVNVSDDVYMIYNFEAYPRFADTDVIAKNGYTKLIDNDRDGEYEVIFVVDYTDYLVEYVSDANKIIYPSEVTGQTSPIKFNETQYENLTVYYESNEVEFNAIKPDDVISVARSKHDESICIFVARRAEGGTLKAINSSDMSVKIGDMDYELSSQCKSDKISVGDAVRLHFNVMNKGAFLVINGDINSNMFGYLIKVAPIEEEDEILLKIFDEKGRIVKYYASEKIRINKERERSLNADGWSKLFNSTTGVTKAQLIAFKLNREDKISEIYTAGVKDDDVLRYAFDSAYDSQEYKYEYMSSPKYFIKTPVTSYTSGFRASDSTVVFKIPVDIGNENGFEIIRLADFFGQVEYNLKAYNLDRVSTAQYLLYFDDDDKTSKNSVNDNDKMICIDDVILELDENNEPVYFVEGYVDGAKTTLICPMGYNSEIESVIATLKTGYIASYRLNTKGYIDRLYVRYNLTPSLTAQVNPRTSYSYSYLKVYEKHATEMIVNVPGRTDKKSDVVSDAAKAKGIYVYDKSRKTLEIGSADSIEIGDEIFMKSVYSVPNIILIIKD